MRFLALAVALCFITISASAAPFPPAAGATTFLTGTISTSTVTVLPSDLARKFLRIVNNSTANSLACTNDGSVPAINGNGITLFPGGAETNDVYVPLGTVICIGSGSGTVYTLEYTP